MFQEQIQKRYAKETEDASLGCANLMPFLEIDPGMRILDLGCGRGYQTRMLALRTGDHGLVFGLDLTPEMIQRAQIENGGENLRYLTGDIHDLPFEEDFFDLMVSNCVINHSRNKARVYAEMFRVLKPGGKFAVADVMAVEALPRFVSEDPAAVAACYGGAIPKDQYELMVLGAGFKNLSQKYSRVYSKSGFLLESIILTGEKP